MRRPVPLPDLIAPNANLTYPPHYLFSILDIDQPVGVTVSPDGERIYVAESGGDRQVKIFDRDGGLLGSMIPPQTAVGERSPVYLTTDSQGRVYVTDRMQHAIYVYDRDGKFLDVIIDPQQTMSEYITSQVPDEDIGTNYIYNLYSGNVSYKATGETEQIIPLPKVQYWSPLGVRINKDGVMLVTDVTKDHHHIRKLDLSSQLNQNDWTNFQVPEVEFGTSGQEYAEFSYPNSAVEDSRGRIYVSDGNNARISVWDDQGNFLSVFGTGTGQFSVSLPRGMYIDHKDRLHIVDAVGQNIKVFDVSEDDPSLLFEFGNFGVGDGQFNFPNDICLDLTGRVYVADRENNRVQVWSY